MIGFKKLLGRTVSRLFLIIWPPWGEERERDIDICFGFVFNDDLNRLYVISVDKDELWLPHITFHPLPLEKYTWADFYPRMEMWTKAEDDSLSMEKECYEVTTSEIFENIVGNKIEETLFLRIENNEEPFGVKIIFKDDYIISLPNSDGNTVETKIFNKNEGVEYFRHLGNVIYSAD